VIVTVALLALGAVAGISLRPEPAAPEHESRLATLEAKIDELCAKQDAVEEAVAPAAEFLRRIQQFESRTRDSSAHMQANEVAAIATLRNIVAAQAQFQQSGKADQDRDGTGEYGGFLEMSGAQEGRMGHRLVPPVLSSAFRFLNPNGEVTRSGYCFALYLPGRADANNDAAGVPEPAPGGYADDGRIDPDLAETTWCCYAWPLKYGETGKRAFFTNQAGDVLGIDDARYSGTGAGPGSDAAFESAGSITGNVAIGSRAADGNLWRIADY